LSEVGALIPSAGAYYTIARRAFGDYLSVVVGWTDWVSLCGATAVITLLAGEYVGTLMLPSGTHTAAIPTAIVVFVTLVPWRGIRWGSRFQNLTSAITALIFFSLIVAAFALSSRAAAPAESAIAIPTGMPLFVSWVLVLQAVIYPYDVWYRALYFGYEIINPRVELPRSIMNGVLLLSAIY